MSEIVAAVTAVSQLAVAIFNRISTLEAKTAALEAKVEAHAAKLEDPPPPKTDAGRKDP